MATPVVTVASGGLPVVDVTATSPKLGLPVTEAPSGRGMPVTKVAARGMPVTYSTVADYPSDLVTNGNFAQNPLNVAQNTVQNGWQWRTTPGTGTATVTWNGSSAVTLTGDGTNTAQISTSIPTVAGVQYQIKVDVASAVLNVLAGIAAFQNTLLNATSVVGLGQTFSFTAATALSFVTFSKPAAANATISNVSITPPAVVSPGPEASAWLARNPGLGAMYVAADTDFINGMVADGIWSKFDYLHIYATESLTVGNRNMRSASYPSSVSAATFTVNRGLLNSGSDHIGAGLIPSAATSLLTLNSAHISMWSNTNTTGPSGWTMGVHSGSYLAITPDWSGTAGAAINDGTGFTNANTGTLGHFLGNRSAINAVQFYKNGALHGSSSNASTSLPGLEIWSLACNENGSPNISPFQLSADSAGSSLTAAEALKFYNRLRTRLTAVGVP